MQTKVLGLAVAPNLQAGTLICGCFVRLAADASDAVVGRVGRNVRSCMADMLKPASDQSQLGKVVLLNYY